ncbi:Hypothetical protein PHPALM_16541, partial [Phytophthora palmivora]
MDHHHVFNANSSDSFHYDISIDYGSAMSDISSGHTEIIPSQSSNSDWSDGHQAVDDDGFNLPDTTERFSSHESNDGSHLSSQENEGRQVEDEITSGGFTLPDSVEPVSGSKSVHYQGYQYSFYHGGGATRNYRCSSCRRTQCLAKLYISRMGAVVRGNHKSDCVPEMRQVPNGPPPTFVNWKQQMLLATDEIGIRDVTLSPREVWQIIREQFYSDDSIIVQGATKKQIMGRETILGGRFLGLKFFQFHFTYYEDEVLHRVIGWSHPLLMDRLKQRHCSLFVDATFRCVPTQFYQLVVVMMYGPISDLYLPVWYVLTSMKTSQIYEHIFHYICVASKKRLDPAHIVCDFEFAMIKAVKDQFPDSRIQALRRKMLKLKITEEEVALAMCERCIDGLTLIRRCDIVFRGIPDVRRMIKRDCRDQ